MDKASDFGSEDCRFESCRGRGAEPCWRGVFFAPPARVVAPRLPRRRYRDHRTQRSRFAPVSNRSSEEGGGRLPAPRAGHGGHGISPRQGWEWSTLSSASRSHTSSIHLLGPAPGVTRSAPTALVSVVLKAPSLTGFLFFCLSVGEASPFWCAPSGSGREVGHETSPPLLGDPIPRRRTRCCRSANGAVGLCLTPLPPGPGVKGFLFPRDMAERPSVTTRGPRRGGGCDGRNVPPAPPRPSRAIGVGPRKPSCLPGIERLRKAPGGCFGGARGGQTSPRGRGECEEAAPALQQPGLCLPLPAGAGCFCRSTDFIGVSPPPSTGRDILAAPRSQETGEKRAIFIGDVRAYVRIRAQHCSFFS
ncbi:translation initiation factor IF-2-like [Myiozetetes cayanensis]|uniref:translation initiation factor IF-2-like n=1 Tax=Myiozetetes cayanensis TaxID=478635 RepID=UPI00215F6BB6|nr:translation initiation factor IF-2-like [Myiozetetes cayanensis]